MDRQMDNKIEGDTSRLTFAVSRVLLSAVIAALYGVQASTKFTVIPM